ncbi:uncharacterized protein EHS24_007095 [Apiotrichum porosum]|uniref:Uncharacterized protein n=1 Tax=Apiotrichum porosum TaxID=105984 RepID=A0A427XX81_9TREE|nr:uncharacterized protein EHS24_007095 [Apiotrichum porosum]RSH83411.1 hypothetical protein EHS24_007095 [Apiotrichum porosum]
MGTFGKDAGAALVFLVLYTCMFCYMTFMYLTKRLKFNSRFTILYFHCLIRMASQACGVAFGILVWDNVNVFIAFLVLSAEGYFSLTIASYYFLKHFEILNFGQSRLGPKDMPEGKERSMRALMVTSMIPAFTPWRYWNHDLIAVIDSWLIPANIIIIAGGSLMAGANNSTDLTEAQIQNMLNTAKGLRTAGQAIFLVLTVVWILLQANTYARTSKAGLSTATNKLFTVVGALLLARGVFGLLQALISSLSYYTVSNYTGDGFTNRFIALEYCLTAVPEFVAAVLLNMSFWTTRSMTTDNGSHMSMAALKNKEDGPLRRDYDHGYSSSA